VTPVKYHCSRGVNMRSPRKIDQLVLDQIRRADAAGKEPSAAGAPCKSMVVTISRGMGSGARIIAGKLADQLGWSLWDRNLLDAIVSDAQVSHRVVEAFDEKRRSELELLVHAAMGNHEMAGFVYGKHLGHAVRGIAKLGNAIILGRGANFILPDALSVRIDASAELRVNNMMSYEHLTKEQAENKIRHSDKERRAFLISAFGKSKVDSFHFDISLWMDRWTNDDAVRILREAIDARCTSGGRQNP
jgi:cytidylate kinase